MTRFLVFLAALFVTAPVFAEQLLYVCERPVWGDKQGCGPDNDVYSTHTFLVETRDYRDENPQYVYQAGKGCDVGNKQKHTFTYHVNPESLVFEFARLPNNPRDKLWAAVTLNLNTMKAVMSEVDNGSELNCRLERG